MIPSLRIVRHTVNFDAMRAFYQDGLDMRPLSEWDRAQNDRGVLLVFNGPTSATSFEILTHPAAGEYVLPSGGKSAIGVLVEVENAGAKRDELAARGVQIWSEPATMPWGHLTFSVKDPDGFEISFYQDLNRPSE